MVIRVLLVLLVVSIAGAFVALWWGIRAWDHETERVVDRLLARRSAGAASCGDRPRRPADAGRALSVMFCVPASASSRTRASRAGEFNIGEPGRDNWRPFTAVEDVVPGAPGFVWNMRISMVSRLPVLVRDAFVEGEGSMHGAVLGLFTVVNSTSTPTLASAALQRYLGEAAWVPTALLPGRGVAWTPIDDARAMATITAGATTVSLEFRFGADRISSVFTPGRHWDDGRARPCCALGRRGFAIRRARRHDRPGRRGRRMAAAQWDVPMLARPGRVDRTRVSQRRPLPWSFAR
jgi:hypothetical protein